VRLEAEPDPDPRLDGYRRGAALVFDGQVLVGHLVTRVVVWWVQVGHFWWRRGIEPSERIAWALTLVPGEAGRFGAVDCVDSVEDDVEAVVDEWAADRFEVADVDYRLEWLHGRRGRGNLGAVRLGLTVMRCECLPPQVNEPPRPTIDHQQHAPVARLSGWSGTPVALAGWPPGCRMFCRARCRPPAGSGLTLRLCRDSPEMISAPVAPPTA
jgi:hypothetical protein